MKRILICLLALALLTGCTSAAPPAETTRETVAETTAEPATEPAAEPETIPETTAETTLPEPTELLPPEPTLNPDAGPSDPVFLPPEELSVDASFFDDAVFVGDSVSVMLSYSAAETGELGKAQFLVKESFSMLHAAKYSMNLEYNGTPMHLEDAIAACGAKKVFLMLGTNDMVYMPIGDTLENWRTVIGRIRQAVPGVKIYIQSCMPVYPAGQKGTLNNEVMDTLNEELEFLSMELDCPFLNVALYMKDSNNGLADPYCSDGSVLLNYTGAEVWTYALRSLVTG